MLSKRPYLVRALYEWTVDQGHVPIIVVDATVSRVVVPTAHVEDGQIHLNISPSAVRNFSMDRGAIAFEARFSGRPESVFVPIRAIMGIYDRDTGSGAQFPPEPDEEFPDDADAPAAPTLSLAGVVTDTATPPARPVPIRPGVEAAEPPTIVHSATEDEDPDDEPPSPKGPDKNPGSGKGSRLRIVK